MDDKLYDAIGNAICGYAFKSTITVDDSLHSISNSISNNTTYQVFDKKLITISLVFDPENFKKFGEDILLVETIKKEENVRRRHPTVQDAYDAYQILLKLSQ